ncbi:MAG: site-specific integrase, partial [Lachnospiraceae bacterium]|nr:site-specific integrase [Lachnospiraceae bacterium]
AAMTLAEAMDNYITSKSNILSPSTIKEYKRMRDKYYSDLIFIPVKKLSQDTIQLWVNRFALNYSPKTVRNAYGFIEAVLSIYNPGLSMHVSLPQKIKPSLYVPSDRDIKALLDYFSVKDKDMELAVYLAAFGTLRRSEICALEASDIYKDTLHICKAMVITPELDWIVKTTKTESSDRYVKMPDFVIQKLPKHGKIVKLNPSQITMRFNRAFKKLNITSFRFHDLRHYAASIMHAIGVPDQYIMARGGWSSDRTLKNIYRGTIEDYQQQFTDRMLNHFNNMQHEMQHKHQETR